MLGYYVGMAVRNMRRNVVLTALMIMAVSVGIGASMTLLTALRAMSADPIPAKSDRLFSVRLDNWGPDVPNNALLSDLLSYPDAMAFMRAHRGVRQSLMYETQFSVTPPGSSDAIALAATARAVYSDFFQMFDVPFAAGTRWSRIDDADHANVIVLGARIAARLFPSGDALGRTLTLGNQDYRIIGVLAPWRFQPRVYDLTPGIYQETEDVFLPLTTAVDHRLGTYGGIYCNKPVSSDFERMSRSECRWVQFWVELASSAQRRSYLQFLNNYSREQNRTGRFHWPPRVSLLNVNETLQAEHIIPGGVRIATVAAFGFLIVCLVNATGLMLAKLSSRLAEFSVRRALGARRSQIFAQCLAEAAAVGVGGGMLGVGLLVLGLAFERVVLREDYARLIRLDSNAVVTALGLALVTVIFAALYPAWHTSRLAPAWKLKAE
ncbi:MAG TPA: ABC transporter permease [Steroidobacteraceae bacterium]|jgi:putative ABC transport system permease protein